jgi:uncharacterized membrane protein
MKIDLSGLSTGDYAYLLLWLFLIYSFAGVLIETFYCWAAEHRGTIESRVGILYLPLNPLYGLGGVAVTVVLAPYLLHPFLVFVIGLVVCTTLEFIASLVMERVFKSIFWDYSDKVLNVQGRVCLQYAIIWGILSLVLIYVLNVINLSVIVRFARPLADGVLLVLSVLVVASIVLTLLAYARTEQKNAYLRSIQAGTDATLPDSWWGRVVDRLVPDSILINSFPRMSIITEYQELSNQPRTVWRLDLHLGRPSTLRTEARKRHDRVHAAEREVSP